MPFHNAPNHANPSPSLADPTYTGDLGDGLICRWSTRADLDKISQLYATVFRDSDDEPLNVVAGDEARIFMSQGFPLMGAEDFALVEDTSQPARPIVAATSYWRRQWSYGGIPFGVGQPENVATFTAYRNRGLVRALFDMFHARSAAAGHLVQAITGIRYFYRQFGYEYALDLGGYRSVPLASIPAKEANEPEPYSLRLAMLDDIPDLQELYNQRRAASLIWHETDDAFWRYHITSWADPAIQGRDPALVGLIGKLHMIVDSDGKTCGYVWLAAKRWGRSQFVLALELFPHVNWQRALPCLLRLFRKVGEQTPPVAGNNKEWQDIGFELGRAHPVYALLGDKLVAGSGAPPYAWYVRVPDVPAFIRHIAPVLEQRLAASILVGYSGQLTLDFYRSGLRLHFEQGQLKSAEPWRGSAHVDEGDAGFPPLVFLQLLFGYRSLAELNEFFPDVWASDTAKLLIDILFPKQPSTVYALTFT